MRIIHDCTKCSVSSNPTWISSHKTQYSAGEGKRWQRCLSSSQTLTHRLLRPLWCGMAEQVIYEDGQWDALKLSNSSVQVFDRLPRGTQSNSSLPHGMLPNGSLPSGTPSRKCARSACDRAEGWPSEDESMNEANPDEQSVAVRVRRQSASVQTGAPAVGSVEGTPADPLEYCSSHRSVQERMSPAAEPTTKYGGKELGPPALAQHINSVARNYKTHHQEGRSCVIIDDRPAESSLVRISTYFDRWKETAH
jgi:hypothetical protein